MNLPGNAVRAQFKLGSRDIVVHVTLGDGNDPVVYQERTDEFQNDYLEPVPGFAGIYSEALSAAFRELFHARRPGGSDDESYSYLGTFHGVRIYAFHPGPQESFVKQAFKDRFNTSK